jgi:two-component system, LytTR family, response regulator
VRHALIVDDERFARLELRRMLAAHGTEVAVVAEAESVAAATEAMRHADADVVFLDVHLGSESGFDLLPQLDPSVSIVFVTAHDAYAIRAFEANAVDYLLKPVEPQRLAVAVNRLRLAPDGDPELRALAYEDRLFLRLDDRLQFLKIASIVAIEAAGNWTRIRVADGRTLVARKALREWDDRLPAQHFVRIHRSTIANLEYVERVEEWSHYSCLVYLRGVAEPLTMSRRQASKLRARLK